MEFWGVEVKAGQPLKVSPEEGKLVHISQAALGESKKDKGESVPLRLKIDEKNYVVGTLSAENIPQITFDLVIEKDFELSHGWKNGSVYFCGYQADNPCDDGEEFGDEFTSDDDDEEIPLGAIENGKLEAKVEKAKPATSKANAGKPESSAKPKVTLVEPSKDDESEDDDSDEDDDDEVDSDDSEGDDDMLEALGGSSDDDDSDEEDEETPKKADTGKKRANESATKTPVPAKKAKSATPQKTDGKGAHVATPHPAKQGGKTPANSNSKSKEQTPKSAGQVVCKSCTKTFNSETALQSHSKAKHAAAK